MRTSLLESIVGALNNPRGEQARKVAAWIKTSPPTLLHNLPNPDFRLDSNGFPIRWSDYGNSSSPYGWQIDYVQPRGIVGDDLSNVRALHCLASSEGARRADRPGVEAALLPDQAYEEGRRKLERRGRLPN